MVLNIMMRSLEKIGHEFIKGSDASIFPFDGWAYIKEFCCKWNGITCYWHFTSMSNVHALRSHLDFCGKKVNNLTECICFDSSENMCIAQNIFGETFGFGVYNKIKYLKDGETSKLQLY